MERDAIKIAWILGVDSKFAESAFVESKFAESGVVESKFAESGFVESKFAESGFAGFAESKKNGRFWA